MFLGFIINAMFLYWQREKCMLINSCRYEFYHNYAFISTLTWNHLKIYICKNINLGHGYFISICEYQIFTNRDDFTQGNSRGDHTLFFPLFQEVSYSFCLLRWAWFLFFFSWVTWALVALSSGVADVDLLCRPCLSLLWGLGSLSLQW